MRIMFTLALLAVISLLNAQQVQFTSNDFAGIQKKMINTNHYYLPLSNDEFLIALGKPNNDDVTIIKSDKNCRTLWSVPNIQGYLAGASLGKNIVIFSAGNSGKNGYYKLDAVHATLLDNASGKIISEKDIPTPNKKSVTDIYVLSDSAGSFKDLILRSTEQDRIKIFELYDAYEDFGYTDDLEVIGLDNNLNVSTTKLDIAAIKKAQFLGCACNNNNDIFLASIQNNTISINRYNTETAVITSTVTANCSFEHEVVKTEGDISIHGDNVLLTCKFDEAKKTAWTIITGIFDFNNKTGHIQQDLLDKEYLKRYAQKTSDLDIIGTEFYNGIFMVVKEFSTVNSVPGSSSATIGFGPVIVSAYNLEMKPLKEVAVDERMSMFYGLPNSFYKRIDNRLYIFFNSTKWSGIRPIYQAIDIDNFSLSDMKEIKISDPKLTMIMYGPGIVWLDHTALLPSAQQTNLLNPNKIVTKFNSVDF
jgi:hypothetical protein